MLSTTEIIFFVKILFSETKREANTPNTVPSKEKAISPSLPMKKPKITIPQHTITGRDVVRPRMVYLRLSLYAISNDRITLNTIVKDRATR